MPRPDVAQLDEQIERLREGGTLTENEVKVLCDKVSDVYGMRSIVMANDNKLGWFAFSSTLIIYQPFGPLYINVYYYFPLIILISL